MRVNEEKISNRRKQRKSQKNRKIILTVAIAIVAILIAGVAYAWSRISQAEDAIHQEVDTLQLRDKELTDDSSFSVLLLGIDNGAYGRDTEVGRSDTMLLVTVNPKQKKTTMISIPRDSYTEIIGYGTFDKLNHAYAFGKEKFAINSVQNMLNIPIDYYVTVDMQGLMGLVNAVGGLEITPALTFTYEDESFTEGVTRHVDGEAALRYARMRYDDPEGDTGRQKRQRIVIEELVKKLMTFNSIANFEQLMNAVSKNVKTDIPIGQVMALKNTYGPAITGNNLTQTFIEERQLLLTNNAGEQIYYSYATDDVLLENSNSIRKLMGQPTVKTYPLLQERQDLYYLTTP